MRKIRTYRGKVIEPEKMTISQLRGYTKWGHEYLEWCLDADGRVNAYDRMSNTLSPYFDELEKREKKTQGAGA